MKQSYELMLILRPEIGEKDTKKRDEAIKKLLGDSEYTLEDIKTLGVKPLAYPITHLTEGLYVLARLSGENISVGKMEARNKLEKSVIRFLLTRAES